jgi:hypothetical protein
MMCSNARAAPSAAAIRAKACTQAQAANSRAHSALLSKPDQTAAVFVAIVIGEAASAEARLRDLVGMELPGSEGGSNKTSRDALQMDAELPLAQRHGEERRHMARRCSSLRCFTASPSTTQKPNV